MKQLPTLPYRNLLKAQTRAVLLAALAVLPVAARCTPDACFAQSIDETTNDDHGEGDTTTTQRPIEADPMDDTYKAPQGPQWSSTGETGPYQPFKPFRGTVNRTDGLPDNQPIRSYFVQPFKGRSQSVTCIQVAPGIQSCN